MFTDLQRDILVKAAEGIQEGMWCRDNLWKDDDLDHDLFPSSVLSGLETELAMTVERCAMGELILRTGLIGGTEQDLDKVTDALSRHIRGLELDQIEESQCGGDITWHNDFCLRDADQFTGGQEWARIFREVAEA